MDCRLPELDGFTATAEIRRREPIDRRTPIVALTASTAPSLRQRCLDAGMSGHLAKPLRTDALDAVLRQWVAVRAEPVAPADDEPLDTAGLLDRVDGDLDFVHELAVGLHDDHPRWLAIGMLAMMAAGFACWRLYLHTARRVKVGLPPTFPGG